MALHGFTDEAEEEYLRALALFEGERDVPQLFPVLRGLAGFHGYRAEFDKAAPAAARSWPGRRPGRPEHARRRATDGRHRPRVHERPQGRLEHLEEGIECFESQRQGAHRFQLGANPGIACQHDRGTHPVAAGVPPIAALQRANRAVALATELQHPFTMAYALFHTGFLHLFRQEPEPMRDRAVGAVDVADEYELQIWRALGTVLLGAARTELGHSNEGLAEISEGWRSTRV